MSLTAPMAAELAVEAAPKPHSGNSRLLRNIAVLAGGQAVTWTLSLVWTVFVPRALGPAGMGELVVATSITSIVSAAIGLGIGTLMVRDIARNHGAAPRLVGQAIALRLVLAVPAVLAITAYAIAIHPPPELALVMALATAAMVVGLFSGPFLVALQAMERMHYVAYSDVLSKAATALVGVALVFVGFRLVALMWLSLAMAAVVLVLSWWWSRPYFKIDWRVQAPRVGRMVIDSLPFWTTGLLLTFYMWIDALMLSVMVPTNVVGWYGVPTKLFGTLLFVPVILATAWLPRLSAAFREGVDPLRKTAKPALELVLVLCMPVAAGTALVAGPLIRDLYGPLFKPSVSVLIILALTLPPTYFNIIANQVLVATNRQLSWTKVMVAAAVINPVLNFFLIQYFQSQQHNGAVGAAISLLVTEVGMAIAGLLLVPGILDSRSVMRLARAAAATAGMVLVVWALNRSGLIVQTVAGAATFGALAIVFRILTTEEFAVLRSKAAWVPALPIRADRCSGSECRWMSRASSTPCAGCPKRWV